MDAATERGTKRARETEATLITAHDHTMTTNAVKVKIHEQQGSPCAGCAKKLHADPEKYLAMLSKHGVTPPDFK